MHSLGYFYIIIWFLIAVLVGSESTSSDSSAKNSLDSLLQQYAFRELTCRRKTRTGVPYDAYVPSNLMGIRISAVMLKRHSLKRRVYGYYKEFFIPSGIIVEPCVKKLVLVYQNLANWSSFYYHLPGYTYLAPVMGILGYDAYDFHAKNPPELDILALEDPITIRFPYVQPAPEGSFPKCVYFFSNNLVEFGHVTNGNVCETRIQGHFSIVAEVKKVAPSPSPSANEISPSPSPSANEISPSPSPSANEISPSPSPSANEISPSPSPSANEISPSPSPTTDENNHQKINSQMWTISLASLLFFSLMGILFVIVKKFGLLEIKQRSRDSAAVVAPLLGNTEVPLPLEAPTTPLPENDYVL